ncbi:hypothetical protein SY88_11995 [Clostridiales bacterium PH28_bin88]|nr:hypothetical protein SY88_11995 [Clostridiales bacterium PH28_bin88]
MTGYVYPNELEVQWSLLIVLYPFITGLVAGAFIVSALYHVFGRTQLKPVARLALVSALSLLMVAPMPLLLHLGQPLRAFSIMWTPNPTSAMAGFGYIYSFYMIIVLLEVWFVFRKDLVQYARNSTGIAGFGYRVLTLGATDLSEATLRTDEKVAKILAAIGIPAAAFLHGYVGFIFGAIKANPWWSTALMPIIFLMSAIVSGTALLMLVYAVTSWFRRQRLNMPCLMALNKYLWYFLTVDVALEVLEVVSKGYEARDEWGAIYGLITERIPGSFFGLQLFLGALVPLVLLLLGRSGRLAAWARQAVTLVSAGLILVGVFAMRWNVVIGGQLVSKSLMGYTVYRPPFMGMEGILPAVVVMALPFMILAIISRILPPWVQEAAVAERPVERPIKAAV